MLRKNFSFYFKSLLSIIVNILNIKKIRVLILFFISPMFLNGYLLDKNDIIVYKVLNSYSIASTVLKISKKENIDPLIVTSVIISESSGYKFAKSYLGATGLMQLMPVTAYYITERVDKDLYKILRNNSFYLYDQKVNINLGVMHLKAMYDFMGQNWEKALHIYNLSVSMYFNGRRNYRYVNDILKRVEKWKDV